MTTRIFTTGPQPDRTVDTVRDIDGDLWERWMADDDRYVDVWAVPFDPDVLLGWDELLREFGPLEDASDIEGEVAA